MWKTVFTVGGLLVASAGIANMTPERSDVELAADEVFLACVNSDRECRSEGQRRGYSRTSIRENHERCHPKPYACYGESSGTF